MVLIAARSWYSHTYHYWFLLWNLALAWVPFVFAGVAYALAPARRRAYLWVLVVLAAVVWLAFFPNAPYILTDFLHLGSMGDIVPGWYDVLMLYWFAWTGLILGVVSLYLMHEIVTRGLGTVAGWVFVVVVAGVGSLGIYLGRFLRWNSWDLVRRPGPLANELLGRVTDPHSQPRLLGFTAPVRAPLPVHLRRRVHLRQADQAAGGRARRATAAPVLARRALRTLRP